jgi:Spy/CpxP family protein refolding chaperone
MVARVAARARSLIMSPRGLFRPRLAFAVAFLAAVAAAAAAQSLNVKPGLWEVTATTQTSGRPPMDLSSLSPEQRAKIEAAMKKQMGEMAKPTVSRECMTREKIDKELFGDKDLDPSCKRTTIAKTATVQELKVECTGKQKMTGTMRFEAVTPESVKGTVNMVAEGAGQTMNANSTFTAKWLADSCGDVK